MGFDPELLNFKFIIKSLPMIKDSMFLWKNSLLIIAFSLFRVAFRFPAVFRFSSSLDCQFFLLEDLQVSLSNFGRFKIQTHLRQ